MKLIFAVVNGDDSGHVLKSLTKNGFYATKLSSSGGFLGKGNVTFMLGVEENEINSAIRIISENSKTRKEYTQNWGTPAAVPPETFPVEVTVGGATIFVTDVVRFEKV
jgi:uncharacterized protein YaaQ